MWGFCSLCRLRYDGWMNIRLSVLILSFGIILAGCAAHKTDPVLASIVSGNTVGLANGPAPSPEITPNAADIPVLESQNGAFSSQTGEGCRAAVATAERENGLPSGLLTAIAGAESGMHPTALRVSGRGIYPQSKEEAQAVAKQALSRSQSVMAGCMQVNLRVHDPKGELWALEPKQAATWAAEYLKTLHNRLGSWRSAISAYGGDRGRSYVKRIERRLDTGLPEEVAEAH
jgi:soluble lytic murein transglycosylase-like protein